MLVPLAVGQLCDQFRLKIHSDPYHHLRPANRLTLYRAFGPTANPLTSIERDAQLEAGHYSFTAADRARVWLGIEAARFVLPIWENANYAHEGTPLVRTMLDMAEEVLHGTRSPLYVIREISNHFYHWSGNAAYGNTFPVWSAANAAYEALDGLFYTPRRLHTDSFLPDEKLGGGAVDTASSAMKAYVSIDNNEPGEWHDGAEVIFDPQKRYEFWKWWLTEAIPQAWARVGTA